MFAVFMVEERREEERNEGEEKALFWKKSLRTRPQRRFFFELTAGKKKTRLHSFSKLLRA